MTRGGDWWLRGCDCGAMRQRRVCGLRQPGRHDGEVYRTGDRYQPMIQGHRHRCLAPVDSPETAMGGSLRLYLDDLGRLSLISPRRGGRHRKGKRNRARTNQLTKTAPSPSLPPSLVASLAHDVRTDPGKMTVFHVIRMVICIAVTVAGQSTKEALHRLGKKLAASWGFKAEQ